MANEGNGLRNLVQEYTARFAQVAEGIASTADAIEAEMQALRDSHQADRQKWAAREDELEAEVKAKAEAIAEDVKALNAAAKRIAKLEKA